MQRTIANILGSDKAEAQFLIHIKHNSPMLQGIIDANPALITAKINDMTLLMSCLFHECDDVAASIIKNNPLIAINEQDCVGRTALMYAIINKCKLSLDLLINHEHTDYFVMDNYGKNVAAYAKQAGRHDLAEQISAIEVSAKRIQAMNMQRRDTSSFFSLLPRDLTEYVLTPMIKDQRTPSL